MSITWGRTDKFSDSTRFDSWSYFFETYRSGGLAAINKGVNAVALRQVTNWGSRIGIARAAEEVIRDLKGYSHDHQLGIGEKVASSAVGGVLGCWNHPIEVVRVEMQSLTKVESSNKPKKLNMFNTFKYIYQGEFVWKVFWGESWRALILSVFPFIYRYSRIFSSLSFSLLSPSRFHLLDYDPPHCVGSNTREWYTRSLPRCNSSNRSLNLPSKFTIKLSLPVFSMFSQISSAAGWWSQNW